MPFHRYDGTPSPDIIDSVDKRVCMHVGVRVARAARVLKTRDVSAARYSAIQRESVALCGILHYLSSGKKKTTHSRLNLRGRFAAAGAEPSVADKMHLPRSGNLLALINAL